MRHCLLALGLLALSASHGCGETRLQATFLRTDGGSSRGGIGGATGPTPGAGQQDNDASDGQAGLGGDLASGAGGTLADTQPIVPHPTLTVSEGALRDHCGDKFVLRGVNEMVIYSEGRNGIPEFYEIAKTGANAVRIAWLMDGTPEELDGALGNARAEQLVPILEFHDGFNEENDALVVSEVVDYLVSPEIVAVLEKYEEALLLEIEGRFGESAPPDEWERIHTGAIARLRDAGLRVPIAINEPSWDDDLVELVKRVQAVLDSDPLENSLFAAAVWDGSKEDFRATLLALQEEKLPVYLGEFSGFHAEACPTTATDVSGLMAICEEFEVGWLAWSWGGVSNQTCSADGDFLDMSSDGTLDGLENWGRTVALEDPNGISRTAVRLRTIGLESCEDR